jgi:chemotaxis protein MotB
VAEVRGYADTKPRVLGNPLAPANRRISILLPFSDTPERAGNAEALATSKRDSLVSNIAQPLRKAY